jgi:methyl-accepting chemotaxis protein
MKLRTKLLLLTTPILAVLLFMVCRALWLDLLKYRDLDNTARLVGLGAAASTLAHELQKERGLSAGYLGSGGRIFAEETRAQRELTVAVYEESLLAPLTTYNDPKIEQTRDEFLQTWQDLTPTRQQVDSLAISVQAELQFYTTLVEHLLTIVAQTAKLAPDAEIARQLLAYHSTAALKEKAGLERAVINNALTRAGFEDGLFVHAISLQASQAAHETTILLIDSDRASREFRDGYAAKKFEELQRIRGIVSERAADGKFGVSPATWWRVATERIDALKRFEDARAAGIMQEVTAARDTAFRRMAGFAILVVLAILACVVATLLLVRDLATALARIEQTATDIANGSVTEKRFQERRRDELGALMGAMNRMCDHLMLLIRSIKQVAGRADENSGRLSDSSDRLSSSAQDLAANAEETSAAHEELLASIDGIQQGIDETVRRIGFVNERVARLSEGTELLANETSELERSTANVTGLAKSGSAVIQQSQRSMEEIRASASRIHEIIEVITGISDQINLLALNASIEAARAGDAGRGFAVVADEVSRLAARTMESVKSVGGQINATTDAIRDGHEQVGHATKIFFEIGEHLAAIEVFAKRTRDAMASRSTDCREIADGVSDLVQFSANIRTTVMEQKSAAAEIDESSQNVNRNSQSLLEAAHVLTDMTLSMRREATDLNDLASRFRLA